jgi:imidazole glycerol phosphate synthase subunit HisF
MSAKQELFEQIAEQFAILDTENGGTTKASQARARKAAGEIKKLITPYKKANMDEVKG